MLVKEARAICQSNLPEQFECEIGIRPKSGQEKRGVKRKIIQMDHKIKPISLAMLIA